MPTVKREIVAEAAVWIARLHGPERTRAMELDCLAWQNQSAEHRLAFERCSDTWQDVGGLRQAAGMSPRAEPALDGRGTAAPRWRRVLIAVAIGLLAAAAFLFPSTGGRYSTGIGEQLAVVLADGTRMTLNTQTDVRVELTSSQRAVEVRRGEALFQVAKDSVRPFVARVEDASVTATGTAFLIQAAQRSAQDTDGFGVTLIEGQIVVQRPLVGPDAPVESIVMSPGDRIRLPRQGAHASGSMHMQLDRPQVERLVAWQRGEVVFDSMRLQDAAAEMNRYSTVKLVLNEADELGAHRVSGVYRTGNNAAFADAVAQLYGLVVSRRGDVVMLSKPIQR